MNIFLDFEATQFGNHLISIGAIAEDGRSFYSLANPGTKNRKKITNFITNLTGITKDMCKDAPDYKALFNKFFDWCFTLGDPNLHFFCYGNCDAVYIEDAHNKVKDELKAEFITHYMMKNLTDYAPNVKEHLELDSEIKLIKVASFYQNELLKQDHNALDDAKLLKLVYEGAEAGSKKDSAAFQAYLEQYKKNTEEN